MMSQSVSQFPPATEQRPLTLSERVNRANDLLDGEIARLGEMLSRVGLVDQPQGISAGGSSVPTPQPTFTTAVDRLDGIVGRLANLVEAARNIA